MELIYANKYLEAQTAAPILNMVNRILAISPRLSFEFASGTRQALTAQTSFLKTSPAEVKRIINKWINEGKSFRYNGPANLAYPPEEIPTQSWSVESRYIYSFDTATRARRGYLLAVIQTEFNNGYQISSKAQYFTKAVPH